MLKRKSYLSVFFAFAMLVSLLVSPGISNAEVAPGYSYLIASANSKIVSAANSTTTPLVAASTTASDAESFKIVNNADGTVSFLAKSNNKYVTATDFRESYVLAPKASRIGNWEKFWILPQEDGTVAIKAVNSNWYVTTDLNNGSILRVISLTAGTNQKFTIVTSNG